MRSTGNFMEHIRKAHSEILHEIEIYRKNGSGADDTNEKRQNKQKTIDEMMKRFSIEEVSIG